MKRNSEISSPYISKRKKNTSPTVKHLNQGEISSGSADEEKETVSSKIFNIYPPIACELTNQVTCHIPKRKKWEYTEHCNAVSHIRWNIPSLSHLLLSSSLDGAVKVWDCFNQNRCVQTIKSHKRGVKDAHWSNDGQTILSGGFDKTAMLTDVETGRTFQEFEHTSFVTCLKICPSDPHLFLAGTSDSAIYCWDTRIGDIIHEFKGKLGQVLAIEFLPGRDEFLASCDLVCRNSDDRNIIVFDLKTTAAISNQIYHEKYTCPCLCVHPYEDVFVAQSNANYIALFSTNSPYRLNKYKRFEGHQVEGFNISCDISPDGSLVASGSSDGKVYIYNYHNSKLLRILPAYQSTCQTVQFHPVLGNVVASASWDGAVTIWH